MMKTLATVLSITTILASNALLAQADDGVVSLKLDPEEAEERGTLPQSYRVYGSPSTIRMALSFVNESDSAVVVDSEALRNAFQIRMEVAGVPVVVRWLPEMRLSDEWVTSPAAMVPLVVASHRVVSWIIALERVDGEAFPPGIYLVRYAVTSLQSAVRKTDNTSWMGRAPSGGAIMTLEVVSPGNPREFASMHRIEARNAFLSKNYKTAAESYARALAADPNDQEAKSGLAGSYLLLRRYAEAVPIYEQLVSTFPGNLTFVLLAQAYLGIGDETDARRALRMSGLSPDRVEAKVAELRGVISRRR